MSFLTSLSLIFLLPVAVVAVSVLLSVSISGYTIKFREFSKFTAITTLILSFVMYILILIFQDNKQYYLRDYSKHMYNNEIAETFTGTSYNDFDIVTVTYDKILGIQKDVKDYKISPNTEVIEETGLLVYYAVDGESYFKINDSTVSANSVRQYVSNLDLSKPVKIIAVKAIDNDKLCTVKYIEQLQDTE